MRFFILLFYMFVFCGSQAQITVYVSKDSSLESQLKDFDFTKESTLIINGILHNEDWDFLRNNVLEYIDTLNLRDANIDTIPYDALGEHYLYVILPQKIQSIEDYNFSGTCEVTGNFPSLGKPIDKWSFRPHFIVSANHPYLVSAPADYSIYSQNGDSLYYLRLGEQDYNLDNYIKIKEGTRVIRSNALRGECFYPGNRKSILVLPHTIDSIGDCAFNNLRFIFSTSHNAKKNYLWGGDYNIGCVICEAIHPPKFGIISEEDPFEPDFLGQLCYLYVPKESIEAYKKAKGWSSFLEIRDLDPIRTSMVESPKVRIGMSIVSLENGFKIHFDYPVNRIRLYDITGAFIEEYSVNSTDICVGKHGKTRCPYMIQVYFKNGVRKTYKL